MISLPNLLIIAGAGNKTGKTSMACRIIESFPDLRISAIKITPHFHEITDGLIVIDEGDGYAIYRETDPASNKDSSRMLSSGAEKVYFAKVWDVKLLTVFNKIMSYIEAGSPVICESPALRNFVEPGVFILMNSDLHYNKKDIRYLQTLPHLMIRLEELNNMDSISIGFEDGEWFVKTEDGSRESEV